MRPSLHRPTTHKSERHFMIPMKVTPGKHAVVVSDFATPGERGIAGKVCDMGDPDAIAEHKRYHFKALAVFDTRADAYANVDQVMAQYWALKQQAAA